MVPCGTPKERDTFEEDMRQKQAQSTQTQQTVQEQQNSLLWHSEVTGLTEATLSTKKVKKLSCDGRHISQNSSAWVYNTVDYIN